MAMLNQLKCTVCHAGDIPLGDAETKEFLDQVPDWITYIDMGTQKIRSKYRFIDFISAMEFTQKVGNLAEMKGHHPVITTEWGNVTVVWWTHKIEGLHKNDFIMATKTDRIYKNMNQ